MPDGFDSELPPGSQESITFEDVSMSQMSDNIHTIVNMSQKSDHMQTMSQITMSQMSDIGTMSQLGSMSQLEGVVSFLDRQEEELQR